MANASEFENLDEEVRELLQNYKYKKATVYEPCTINNVKECLIGLHEEFGLLNLNYIFNPHIDMDNENNLTPEALVNLINSVWTMLHYYKTQKDKADSLLEHNHVLEQRNKQLNGSLSQLKDKLSTEKNEARACVASAQRVADRSEDLLQTLTETKAKLIKVSKQKEGTEKSLRNEIARLKQENNKLLDKLRLKSNIHVTCSEVCDSTLLRLKERDRKHLTVISQLQNNNRELIREVLTLKEDIILRGINSFDLSDTKK